MTCKWKSILREKEGTYHQHRNIVSTVKRQLRVGISHYETPEANYPLYHTVSV